MYKVLPSLKTEETGDEVRLVDLLTVRVPSTSHL